MSGIDAMRRMAVIAALVVTIASAGAAIAQAPSRGAESHGCVQVAGKDNSDGQETHG